MDFFGFGDLSTPVGKAVERATNELLLGPDWSANMDICDMIRSDTSPEENQKAVKALKKRLKSDNPKIVQLTMTLCETCVKNCGNAFHEAISPEFMNDMVALTEGRRGWEVREQALGLIQQWGKAFEPHRQRLPIFSATYEQLVAKNVQFPPLDEASLPTITAPSGAAAAAGGGGPSRYGNEQPATLEEQGEGEGVTDEQLAKLRRDLSAVSDKVALCREMLPQTAGVAQDDAFAEVVGFLEACRPRMVDLVEAGMRGLLGEDHMGLVLQVNDALNQALEDEKAGPGAAGSSAAATAATTGDLLDLGSAGVGGAAPPYPKDAPRPAGAPAAAAAEDVGGGGGGRAPGFDPFAAAPPPPGPAPAPAPPAVSGGEVSSNAQQINASTDDDFEAFLRESSR